MAFPLPDRPSIAVLPFNNISDDGSQEYFADGMTENLITDLSKISGLFVISRNSSFTYKGKPVKIRQVAEDLGIRYVLEGSIQRSGETVRINAQLIDATTGGHFWAERYDGSMTDVFGLQDQITGNIVQALAPKLMPDWEKQANRRASSNPEAYDSFLKGWNHYIRWTQDDFVKAIPHLEQAIALDPTYGLPYAALASIYWEGGIQRHWYEEPGLLWGEAKTRAKDNLQLALKYPTPLAYRVAALANLDGFNSDYESAEGEAQKAIALDPNDPEGHITLAHVLTMAGKPNEAISFVETAMRLDPKYPPHYTFELALAYFMLGEFEKTAELLEEAIARNPKDFFPYFLLVPTYAHLGREAETTAAVKRLTEVLPTEYYKVAYHNFWGAFEKREHHELMVEGRKKAGAYSYHSR